MDEIKEINPDEFQVLMTAYPTYPWGRYLLQIGDKWVAVDHSVGEAFTEEFSSREEAVSWLNGEFEVVEGESCTNTSD